MKKEKIEYFKNKLEQEKKRIKAELSTFTIQNPETSEDYITRKPIMGEELEETIGEIEEDEVEEYANKLPVESALEKELLNINNALKRIQNGTYGICEICKKEIQEERLEANPSTTICSKCVNN